MFGTPDRTPHCVLVLMPLHWFDVHMVQSYGLIRMPRSG
jgi:hypothetical protein